MYTHTCTLYSFHFISFHYFHNNSKISNTFLTFQNHEEKNTIQITTGVHYSKGNIRVVNLLNNLNTYNQNHIALLRRKPLKAKLVLTKIKLEQKNKKHKSDRETQYNTTRNGTIQ